MKWTFADHGPADAQLNMQRDRLLLQNCCPEDAPLLCFYDWNAPSLTYGYFFNPDEISLPNIAMARRPTGGGILFHSWDLTFTLLIPAKHPKYTINTLQNYAYINGLIVDALQEGFRLPAYLEGQGHSAHSFCMAGPVQYDVMVDGRKICGGAQRRTKRGILHQGSLMISLPPFPVINAIQYSSYCLLQNPTTQELMSMKSDLKKAILKRVSTEK